MSAAPPRIAVLTIGDELLSGEVQDTNLTSIASALSGIGMRVSRHVTVPDDIEGIASEVRALTSRHDAVLVTGGLGPTSDDLTGEAVALAAGVELVFHPHLEQNLLRFFETMGREMSPENLKQAYLPAGAVEVPAAGGTAPGFMMDIGGALVAVLPGVPREMESMMESQVLGEIKSRLSGGPVVVTRRIMTFGMGESDVAARVSDIIDRGSVKYGFLVMRGPVVIKLTASGASREEAEAVLDEEQEKVASRLGSLMYAVDDEPIEEVVGKLLRERGLTISTAESLTAGMVSAALANIPGSSDYLRGGVVAYGAREKQELLGVPPELLEEGAVSRQVAEAMAAGARRLFATDIAVATTGVAGPGTGGESKPAGTVAIAVAHPDGVLSLERRLPGPRPMVRNIAALAALNMVRLHLAEGPG